MQRLLGQRVEVHGEGLYAGLSAEVEALVAWPIRWSVIRAVNAYFAAEEPDVQIVALGKVYDLFEAEGQPTWTLADHRGPIPPTSVGMWRLPLPLILGFVDQWVSPPGTAVDELIPEGPVRDELNRRLRKAKSEG